MLLFIIHDSNDSLYRITFQYISCYSLSTEALSTECKNYMFQYISCYSLSDNGEIRTSGFKFQYISCYSLSCQVMGSKNRTLVSIHLMLLFIFSTCQLIRGGFAVSIHLMLLFISSVPALTSTDVEFQYISCYSLSLVL